MGSMPPPGFGGAGPQVPPPAGDLPPTSSGGAGMEGLVAGGGPGGPEGAQGGAPNDPKAVVKQITIMCAELDQALMALSQVFGQTGGEEVGQARKLVEMGARKFVQNFGQAVSNSPTEAGSQFPGGGFTQGR